jgi:ubiquinone/menaquinone biosynthesis C-methylase UbiE
MPIFRKGPGPYALAVAMSGIRMGERLLWIGAHEAAMFGAVAKKVVDSEAGAGRIRDAAARAGVLVDLETAAAEHLPFDADSFDIGVIAGPVGLVEGLAPGAQLAVLTEARRVLRSGGRMLVVERFAHRRLFGLMAPGDRADLTGQQAEAALQAAGFRPVRTLARREGLLFIEGLKRGE